MECVLIFPHQLFENHPGLKKDRLILFLEDPRFFSEFRFHQYKLIFHRACLKSFEKTLKKKGYKTQYIAGDLENILLQMNVSTLFVVEFDDVQLENKILSLAKRHNIKLQIDPSPGFLTSCQDFQNLFKGKKRLRFETFYIYQRKKWDLLLDQKGKPLGGKWSFDAENRKRLPKGLTIPQQPKFKKTKEIQEAIRHVACIYPTNPGSSDAFNYPTTHSLARKALNDFLENRLFFFGDYEDAIIQKEQTLFHSCLSPLLNAGLLTPQEVVEQTLNYCKNNKVSLNNLEGFLRQVVGWREFIRGVYHLIGEKERNKNCFSHYRKMPQAFYEGTSGIIPIDETIKKLQKSAYVHHIERLMVLGNFFLLCEIEPNEIYKWFMEYFIDAYDWVMVPNVYGMSQFADGGMMTTKPYFSSSNYILKMSDYPKGEWCKIWDALFWRFVIKNEKFFESQPRMGILSRLAKEKKKEHALQEVAESFLKRLK